NGATQITGRAKDESGIASIRINGKNIDKIEEDGLFITNLTLKPGANSVTIIATDKQNNISAKTFSLTGAAVVKKKDKEPDIPAFNEVTPTYYAILIAERDYTDPAIPDLQNPVKDARELKNILETQYTFNKENIDTLYNRSREDIMQTIVQRCNTLTGNDNLVIFYAGHGTAEKDKFGDVDGYWIPVSAKRGVTSSYISASDINTSLKRSSAKHILLIADACFSGAFTRQLPGDAGKAIQKQYQVSSRKVMASGNLEPVPDNSKFLYYLKKSLQNNNEKYLSAKKLFDSFYDAILNNSENLPQYAAIKNVGDEGGEFVFIKK
ncbi:MAG: caspase family protein, partial [Ferruginibacter sp.]